MASFEHRNNVLPQPSEVIEPAGGEVHLCAVALTRSLDLPPGLTAGRLQALTAGEWDVAACFLMSPTLSRPLADTATVVVQTIVQQYQSLQQQLAVADAVGQAGRRVTRTAPLAWASRGSGEGSPHATPRAWKNLPRYGSTCGPETPNTC